MSATIRGSMALFVLVLLSGCATNRGYMKLDVPSAAATVPTSEAGKGRAVVIDSVQDMRQFQDDPSDPSIPSLKKGEKYQLDAEQRKRAIARKRNGFGKAIGDILLEGPDTVESLTRNLVIEGLQRNGYRVETDGTEAPANATHLRVKIGEFWAWFTPGFWTVDMEAKIRTVLAFSGPSGDKQIVVAAYGKKSAPTGREDNWHQAYERAFADYAQKFDAEIGKSGL